MSSSDSGEAELIPGCFTERENSVSAGGKEMDICTSWLHNL